jgi:4-hydroxy-tetrahydrodipicolinate synthase
MIRIAAVLLSQEAEKSGADALLSSRRTIIKQRMRGLIKHYTYIADRIGIR